MRLYSMFAFAANATINSYVNTTKTSEALYINQN